MELTIKAKSDGVRELTLTVEPAQVAARFEEVLTAYQARAALDGFRRGKAPRELVAKQFAAEIEREALDLLTQEAYDRAIEQAQLKPIAAGQVTTRELTADRALHLTCLVEVEPEFTLAPYDSFELTRTAPPELGPELERELALLQDRLATYQSLDRAAANGDFVLVDYTMFDGARPVDKTSRNVLIQVGDELNFVEINRGLVGVRAGETRTVTLRLPADYPDRALADKELGYRFEVRDVKEKKLPPVDDELARSLQVASLAELRERLTAELTARADARGEQELMGQLYDQLLARSPFGVPPSLVADAYDQIRAENRLDDSEELRTKLMPAAEKRARLDLILDRIAAAEKVEVTEADVRERIEQIARALRRPPEETEERLLRMGRLASLRIQLRRAKTGALLRSRARVS